jgi:solute carrier family 25 protein 34/35
MPLRRSAADPSPTVLAAIVGNPLFLVKARMQAYSPFNPVGVQHAYKGTWDGLKSIVKVDGVKGLWRGVDASMLRTAMGSSVSDHRPVPSRGYLN